MHKVFELGEIVLQPGSRFAGGFIAYQTYGSLNADRTNAIVYTTPFGSQHTDIEGLIGAGLALDPSKYFIVVPNLIGNGLSVSPSNAPPPHDRGRFPNVTIHDNVVQQRRLLGSQFGIERVELVVGFSMGAQQAYHWGALYPREVKRIAAICGTARTPAHTAVILESLKAALRVDAEFRDGRYSAPPQRGLRAVARAFAAWALSAEFYREQLYRCLGFASKEEYIERAWEANLLRLDANNLIAMWWAWQNADISANDRYRGDLARALAAIEARTFVMPGTTDQFFPVEDCRREVGCMPNAVLRPIESAWGHRAGNAMQSAEIRAHIDAELRQLLAS